MAWTRLTHTLILPMLFVLTCSASPVNQDSADKAKKMKLFKQYLLEQLELKEEPRTPHRYVLPRSLEELQAAITSEILPDEKEADKTNAVVTAERVGINTYKFDFSSVNLNESKTIHSARLAVSRNMEAQYEKLRVEHVPSKELITKISVTRDDGDIILIDITNEINEWVNKKTRKNDILRIKIVCENAKHCLSRKSLPFIDIDCSTQSRVARRNNKCQNDGRCCLHSFSYTTQELGWQNWLVYPKVISLYYCAGTCSDDATLSFHGKLAAIATGEESKPRSQRRKPCCMPNKFENLYLMHLKDNHTTYVQALNIVVKECACG